MRARWLWLVGACVACVACVDFATPPSAPLKWVVVVDVSRFDHDDGASGADVCGVIAECDGDLVFAKQSHYLRGSGALCEAVGPECSADRTDGRNVFQFARGCDADSTPSDYLSLGMEGLIALDFGRPLTGCGVLTRVLPRPGEQVRVFVCDMPGFLPDVTCVDGFAEGAGDVVFAVPE